MLVLQTPAALLLYLAALLLTALGAVLKKGPALSYSGGLCWAAFAIAAWLFGVSLRELLALTLLLLAVSALRFGKEDGL